MDFVIKHSNEILIILFLASEIIGETEKLKASSLFGLVRSFLKGESIKAFPKIQKIIEAPEDKA